MFVVCSVLQGLTGIQEGIKMLGYDNRRIRILL